MQQWGIETIYF